MRIFTDELDVENLADLNRRYGEVQHGSADWEDLAPYHEPDEVHLFAAGIDARTRAPG